MIPASGAGGPGFDSRNSPLSICLLGDELVVSSDVLIRLVIGTKVKKCPDPGSNWGPPDLQSDALPTELSGLDEWCRKSNVVW